jgi:hypothetical protein
MHETNESLAKRKARVTFSVGKQPPRQHLLPQGDATTTPNDNTIERHENGYLLQ